MTTEPLEARYALEVYPRRGINVVRGEGALIWDSAGNEYLDCAAGVGVANIGHSNPAVADAVAKQAKTLLTCPGIFHNDRRGELMQKLVNLAPQGLNRVFLCNSGTESVEAAIKLARASTGRSGLVTAMRGFHGRTLGALSATFKYRDAFEPLLPGNTFVPLNNIEKLDAAIGESTSAVILEVVQGEGGVRPAEAEYLAAARRLCTERGALLIIDEVQTGFCRTGRFFACEHFALHPDMMCLAKGIAGGVPMGAVLCADSVIARIGVHGSTFGGNPLACAAASAAVDFMCQEKLAERAAGLGAYFAERFSSALPESVRELRQLGLMIGIELRQKATPFLQALLEHRIIALPAGPTVIRLLPPLTIAQSDLDRVVSTLQKVL
ncbi:MAG: aspartate aminotransferase family protein [Acidiferrobacteraceae bacterium]|nr:aspartate aminotransferase family protein [Acidiferrobacteraceae bacterium]MDP6919593.1 aminotransferase class III-fold pyridoxal phosphate-dependent enzyme [Arenicellales bacterium]